jgi:hypothetical protein
VHWWCTCNGARQGSCARMKEVNPQVSIFHCLLHRENIASQKLSVELDIVMKEIIQVVKFIKYDNSTAEFLVRYAQISTPNTCIYSTILRSGGCHETTSFSITQWGRNVSVRKNYPLAPRFSNSKWILKLVCLSNIFAAINNLNRIWGSHGGEYEDGCLLGYSAVLSGRSLPTFQRSLLPPSPWRWRQQEPLKCW